MIDQLEIALEKAVSRGAISNDEFALFRYGVDDWRAEAGNPASCVNLGESCGEAGGRGVTPADAIASLIRNLAAMRGDPA